MPAALAYYANMTDDKKQEVLSFFRSLDRNGDGAVSIQEYMEFVKKHGGDRYYPANLFQLLDKNNDGTLDFAECVTLFYMLLVGRIVVCDGCRCFLWGLYFLCVECYKANGNTFDLCAYCYGNKKYNHAHAHFMDNYALLRMKPWQVTTLEKVDKRGSKRAAIKEAIEDFNMSYDIGQAVADSPAGEVVVSAVGEVVVAAVVEVVAASCTIM